MKQVLSFVVDSSIKTIYITVYVDLVCKRVPHITLNLHPIKRNSPFVRLRFFKNLRFLLFQ
jgi:hypothetical protein